MSDPIRGYVNASGISKGFTKKMRGKDSKIEPNKFYSWGGEAVKVMFEENGKLILDSDGSPPGGRRILIERGPGQGHNANGRVKGREHEGCFYWISRSDLEEPGDEKPIDTISFGGDPIEYSETEFIPVRELIMYPEGYPLGRIHGEITYLVESNKYRMVDDKIVIENIKFIKLLRGSLHLR